MQNLGHWSRTIGSVTLGLVPHIWTRYMWDAWGMKMNVASLTAVPDVPPLDTETIYACLEHLNWGNYSVRCSQFNPALPTTDLTFSNL
jgi:hypothetical protein